MARGAAQGRRRGGTRELLLEEAERAIARLGIDGFALKDVAEPLGIKVPSIYAHFDSRDAIVAAVSDRYIQELAHQFPEDLSADPLELLVAGAGGLVIFFASNPAYVRLKLRDLETPGGLPALSVAAEGEPKSNISSGPVAAMFDRLQSILRRGEAAGQIRRVEPIDFYRLVFGVVLTGLTYPGQDIFTARQNASEVARIISLVDETVRRFVRP